MATRYPVPALLMAGATLSFDAPYGEFPPPDWSLRFALRREDGGTPVVVAAIDTGGAFRVTLTSTETAALTAGLHVWNLIAEHDASGERHKLVGGVMGIEPDALTETGDTRSAAVRILAAIEATIEGRATKDAESYSIEGRSISRTPVADLLRLRNVYAAQVNRERGGGGPIYRRVKF